MKYYDLKTKKKRTIIKNLLYKSINKSFIKKTTGNNKKSYNNER